MVYTHHRSAARKRQAARSRAPTPAQAPSPGKLAPPNPKRRKTAAATPAAATPAADTPAAALSAADTPAARSAALCNSSRSYALRLMLHLAVYTGKVWRVYCGRCWIARSTVRNAGFGLFAYEPVRKGEALVDIARFGPRVRFQTSARATQAEFSAAADAFLRKRWQCLAAAWNAWLANQRAEYRGRQWDFDGILANKIPLWAQGAFRADAGAPAHPYVAGTETVREGGVVYEDYYDPFLTQWGFINHNDQARCNLRWAYSPTEFHVVEGKRIKLLQLVATRDIAPGEEFFFEYGTDYYWTAPTPRAPTPPLFFPCPAEVLPPLLGDL